MYVDYEFYKEEYGGNKISLDEFINLSIQAKSLIDYYTFNRIKEVDDNVKYTVCELMDHLKDLEDTDGKEIASEKVGSYSVTYVASNQDGVDPVKRKQKEIIYKHLAHTGLLYRGV